MRNKVILGTAVLLAVGFCKGVTTVSADVKTDDYADYIVEQQFEGWQDTDKVLEVDGGYLKGRMYLGKPDVVNGEYDLSKLQVIDSNNSDKAITVSEAKKDAKVQFLKDYEESQNPIRPLLDMSTRGAAPSGNYKGMGPNDTYHSAAFTASGWRFAEAIYYNSYRSGGPLIWASSPDTGYVGSESVAWNVYNTGSGAGTVVNSSAKAVNVGGDGFMTYYTYSPISGTQYFVAGME